MIRVALYGCGYWGQILARVFSNHPDFKLVAAYDDIYERALKVREQYKMEGGPFEAAIIATTPNTHHEIARNELQRGCHIWVEKPMTMSLSTAYDLVYTANRLGKVLFVDHTYLYHGAIQSMKFAHKEHRFYSYDSIRTNYGTHRSDCSVAQDLLPHDLAIMDYLTDGAPVREIKAGGHWHRGTVYAEAHALWRQGDMLAHANVNWLAPRKRREITLVSDSGVLTLDEMAPDTPQGQNKLVWTPYGGEGQAVSYVTKEALAAAATDFANAIKHGITPRSNGALALRVQQALDRIEVEL